MHEVGSNGVYVYKSENENIKLLILIYSKSQCICICFVKYCLILRTQSDLSALISIPKIFNLLPLQNIVTGLRCDLSLLLTQMQIILEGPSTNGI